MIIRKDNITEDKWSKFYVKLKLCEPILPCVQTVWEEARPNTILIRTNGARKGPA